MDFATMEGSLPRTSGVLNLDAREAFACLSAGAVLVDLREAYETNFRVFDVPEVVYLPWTAFEGGAGALPRDRPLVLADAAGLYGHEAARFLIERGRTNVASLSGGMIDWDAEGLPVRKDENYELGGQCACKIKPRQGGNPLIDKRGPQGGQG